MVARTFWSRIAGRRTRRAEALFRARNLRIAIEHPDLTAPARDMLIADALLRFAEWCEQERGRG